MENQDLLLKGSATYFLRIEGVYIPFGIKTREGGSSYTQSTESSEDNVSEQTGAVAVNITSVTRTFAMDSLIVDPINLEIVLGDATLNNGNLFLGKDGGITPKYYELFVHYEQKAESGKYRMQYFRRVAPDYNLTIANSREDYQSLPTTFNLLSDPDAPDNAKYGIFYFETDVSSENLEDLILPTFDGTITSPLNVQTTSPVEGTTTTPIASKIEILFNEPIRSLATATLQTVAGVLVDTDTMWKSTVSGKAQVGSNATSFIHSGDAYPDDAFVGSKVRISFTGNVVAEEIRTITAYDKGTKKFTVGAGVISASLSGMGFEILAGYVKLSPKAVLTKSTNYEILVAGFIDENGNKMSTGGRAIRFTTVS